MALNLRIPGPQADKSKAQEMDAVTRLRMGQLIFQAAESSLAADILALGRNARSLERALTHEKRPQLTNFTRRVILVSVQ